MFKVFAETISEAGSVLMGKFPITKFKTSPLMYHIIERNERRNRQSAFLLAVTLHVALGAFIYLQTGEKPARKAEVAQTAHKSLAPKARPVAQP